jgi:hypothetical protein
MLLNVLKHLKREKEKDEERHKETKNRKIGVEG